MRHPYHLVEPSPWPFLISLNLLFSLIGTVSYLSGYNYSILTLKLGFLASLSILIFWLYDIISESLYMGFHPLKVQSSFVLGFILFVLTELMLFFSLFWAYFHSALAPSTLIWPPVGIDLINPWSIPLLNTLLLLYSGVAATWAHHAYLSAGATNNKSLNRTASLYGLGLSIFLGVIFLFLQGFEYYYSTYDITDSIYSSAFYILTGAHGLHVLFGLLFLTTVWLRLYKFHNPNIIYDLSLIYWHMVDVVWIALFILVYFLSY